MLKFFAGMLLAGLFCGASAVLAEENGTEDCNAVALERVLAQARGVLADTDFLLELKLEIDDLKKVAEGLMEEQNRKLEEFVKSHEQSFIEGKREYDEVMNHYGGETTSLRND